MSINNKLIFTCVASFVLYSCQPEPITNNTQELVTTVRLQFKNSGKTFQYKIVNSIVTKDTIRLSIANSDTFEVSILDESKATAINLTNEIKAEKNDHQLFYTPSPGLNLSTRYLDKDDKDFPIGLSMEITTSSAGKGNLRIVLKHQPDIKNGSSITGSTDADVTFPVIIE